MNEEQQNLIAKDKDELTHEERQKVLEYGRYDLEFFAKFFFANKFLCEFSEAHRTIHKEYLDDESEFIAIAMPRGYGKSENSTFLCSIHAILYQLYQFILIISEAQGGQAVLFLEEVKTELSENEKIHAIFGDVSATDTSLYGGRGGSKWSIKEITTHSINHDGTVFKSYLRARGIDQAMRGTKWLHFRPELVFIDDVQDPHTVKTWEKWDSHIDWHDRVLEPSLSLFKHKVMLIANYTHDKCLIKHIMDKSIEYKKIKFYAADRKPLDGYPFGKSTWESGFPTYKLRRKYDELKARNRLHSFWAEYFHDTTAVHRQTFQEKYFKYYDGYFVNDERMPGANLFRITAIDDGNQNLMETDEYIALYTFIGIDTEYNQDLGAFTAIICIGVDSNNRVFIIDYICDHLSSVDAVKKFLEFDYIYKPRRSVVEKNGGQSLLKPFLEDYERERNLEYNTNRVANLNFQSVHTEKFGRIEGALEGAYRRGLIYHKKHHTMLGEHLINVNRKSKDFPVDLADALSLVYVNSYPAPSVEKVRENAYKRKLGLSLDKYDIRSWEETYNSLISNV